MLIVDTGVLVAAADRNDPDFGGCSLLLETDDGPLITTAMVIAEAAHLHLGGTDAGVIAIAERLGSTRLATLDHRHYRVVRPNHCDAFQLLP